MGNCCSSSSTSSSPFSKPGRTLGAAPAAPGDTPAVPRTNEPPASPKRASVPNAVSRPSGTATTSTTAGGGSNNDPRSAAARAAEERAAKAGAPKGKLGEALAQERRQTRTDTLEAASRQERAVREADRNTRALQHD